MLIAGGVLGGGAVLVARVMGLSASKGNSASTLFSMFKMPAGCPPPSSATGNCAALACFNRSHATFGNAGVGLLVGGGVVGIATILYGVAASLGVARRSRRAPACVCCP